MSSADKPDSRRLPLRVHAAAYYQENACADYQNCASDVDEGGAHAAGGGKEVSGVVLNCDIVSWICIRVLIANFICILIRNASILTNGYCNGIRQQIVTRQSICLSENIGICIKAICIDVAISICY